MYGKQFSSRDTSASGGVEKSQGRVWTNECDGLIAKYSKPTTGFSPAKDPSHRTVSLIDSTNSYGDLQGVETLSFDKFVNDVPRSKYNLGLHELPGLEAALSTETAELIKKATCIRADVAANLGGNSFPGSLPSTSS